MTHLYSKPDEKWDGFRPVAYFLDDFLDLALTRVCDGESPQQAATTIRQVLSELSNVSIQTVEDGITTEVTTTSGATIELAGPSFNRSIVAAILGLQKDGINYLETEWFWYDKDYCTEDAINSYSFFVVHEGTIVRERAVFFDNSSSGFDPAVFKTNVDSESIWSNERDWEAAMVRQKYGKFYMETAVGRLMVLRPDKPTLYYYRRSQDRDLEKEVTTAILAKMYRLVMVAVPLLVAIAFPFLGQFMAILGGALLADYLIVCWRTRNLGADQNS